MLGCLALLAERGEEMRFSVVPGELGSLVLFMLPNLRYCVGRSRPLISPNIHNVIYLH